MSYWQGDVPFPVEYAAVSGAPSAKEMLSLGMQPEFKVKRMQWNNGVWWMWDEPTGRFRPADSYEVTWATKKLADDYRQTREALWSLREWHRGEYQSNPEIDAKADAALGLQALTF